MSHPAFTATSTGEEVATALQDNIRGKNVFLVGATLKSLGAEFLRVIAPYAKTIWVAGRSESRLQAAIDEALASVPAEATKPEIHLVKVDMTSFESIRQAAEQVNAQGKPIDVLLLNVMIHQTKLSYAVDGFESQFTGNHLGTFLLTSLLFPRLKQAGAGARVIPVSSDAHAFVPFRWDDPNYRLRPEEYDSQVAYGHSKFANALYTKELAKRAAPDGILAFTLHPGLVATNGVLSIPDEIWARFGASKNSDGTFNLPPGITLKSIPEGVATYVAAAFDPLIKDQSGSYLVDSQVNNDRLSPDVTEENAGRLWKMTEEMVGVKFL